jgi:hypothetical protein
MATTADAELILKLYDLRREAVCREARRFFINWSPINASEVQSVQNDRSRQDRAYVRQVMTYWEMAFSIVNTGAIDEELFAKNCGEGLVCAIKCQHLAKSFPGVWTESMPEAESFLAKNPIAKQKGEMIRKRFA